MSATIGNNLNTQLVQGNSSVSKTSSSPDFIYGKNGVDNKGGAGSTSTTVTSKIDKFLAEIADKYENLTAEELKECLKQANFDFEELLTATEEELQRKKSFIEHMVKECAAQDGNVDKEKLAQKAQDMAETKEEIKKHGFTGIIKKYLPAEYKNIQSLSEIKDKSVIVQAIKTFIDTKVKKEIEQLKASDPAKQARAKEKTKAIFQQLLQSTSSEDKIIIFGAFMELVKEDKEIVKFMGLTLDSMSVEERQQFIKDFISQNYMAKMQALGISGEAFNEIVANISKNANANNLEDLLNQIDKLLQSIGDNKAQLSAIVEKIQTATQELGRTPTEDELSTILTTEEIEIYKNFRQQIGMLAGFGEGAAQNEHISKDECQNIMGMWNDTLVRYDVQNDVYNEIKNYIEIHKNDENVSVEKIINTVNKTSDGEFANVTGLNTAADVPGYSESKTAVASDGLGFSVKSQEEIAAVKQNIAVKEQEVAGTERFFGTSADSIQYNSSLTASDEQNLTFKQAISSTKSFQAYITECAGNLIEAFNHYGSLRGNETAAVKELKRASFDTKVNTMLSSNEAGQKAALNKGAVTLNSAIENVLSKPVLEEFKENKEEFC